MHLRTLADKAHEVSIYFLLYFFVVFFLVLIAAVFLIAQLNSLREKILDCEHVQKDLMSEYEKQTARLRNEVFLLLNHFS